MSTTYILRYSSRNGRLYETEISTSLIGDRLIRMATSLAREEIRLHWPKDDLCVRSLSINFAGLGDQARR